VQRGIRCAAIHYIFMRTFGYTFPKQPDYYSQVLSRANPSDHILPSNLSEIEKIPQKDI